MSKQEIVELQDYEQRILSKEEAVQLQDLEHLFLERYAAAPDRENVETWLPSELHRQLPGYSSTEIDAMSEEIVTTLEKVEKKKTALSSSITQGRGTKSWLARELETANSHMSAQEAAKYLQSLDTALEQSYSMMLDTVRTKAGIPSQNPNLHGFIAEQHHAKATPHNSRN